MTIVTEATGLTTAEARARLAEYGENTIAEKRVSPWRKFLVFFWGPIPWMIEIAALLSAATGRWEEFKADNAIEALKQRLAQLVETAQTRSHFQQAVLRIGNFLILTTLGLVSLVLLVALFRGDPFIDTLLFALILTVAAIPVALPAVMSVTLAVGAATLAAVYGWLLEPIGWTYALGVWAYALAWFPVNNAARVWVLDLWERGFNGQVRHLDWVHASLHACDCPPASCACPTPAGGSSATRASKAQA